MSDMTDAEYMRQQARLCGGRAEAIMLRIADRLDAMGWRKEPPDTAGWWLRDRDHHDWEKYLLLQIVLPLRRNVHIPGDLWLKLPEMTR